MTILEPDPWTPQKTKPGNTSTSYQCYQNWEETERFRRFSYEELAQRDKLNLDIFWLKDDSIEDIDNLPEPDILAGEIVENLQAALEQFQGVTAELGKNSSDT